MSKGQIRIAYTRTMITNSYYEENVLNRHREWKRLQF